jgi:phage terminase large subunit GpA-like protein
MLANGVWIASEPGRRIAGFHLSALYSPWKRWPEIVREFLEAKGHPELLKQWVNTILGETWEEEGERVDAHILASRREPHANETRESGWGIDPYVVPVGVGVLTASVDVQGDRLELKVKGYGAGMESWLIAFEQIWGDPSRADVWAMLEQWRERAWQHVSGAVMHIAAMAVDTGGHHAQQVYAYARDKPSVWPIKGSSEAGRPVWGRPSKPSKYPGARLGHIGTDTAKDLIFARMRIREPGPGYTHIPRWADDEYLAQLTSERVVTRYVKGRPVRKYEKPSHVRNEALDLEVYALAALFSRGPYLVESLGLWATSIAAEGGEVVPKPEEQEQPRERAQRPRGSQWVQGWR